MGDLYKKIRKTWTMNPVERICDKPRYNRIEAKRELEDLLEEYYEERKKLNGKGSAKAA